MTLLQEVKKYDAYYIDLKKRHLEVKKHPENYTENQLDDIRVEWAFNKSDLRDNEYKRDVLDLGLEIINSFLITDETIPVSDLMKRLDIGTSVHYDIEQGMMTMALRELEKNEAIKVIREPSISVAYQTISQGDNDPATPGTVDGHGISKCVCDQCQVQLIVSGEL